MPSTMVLSPTRTSGSATFAPGLPAADQSRHADWSISVKAWPSGLCAPSTPMSRGLTTGASHPSTVKCGVFANAFNVVAAELGADLVEVLEVSGVESVDEDVTTVTPDGVADVPFAAKSAARVSSASRTNFLLPVRRARR